MIPPFADNGLLPAGVYTCSLDEVRDRFGSFQVTDRRSKLYAGLELYLQEAKASGLVTAVILNGSFVTAEVQPNDIDVIIAMRPGHDMAVDLRPLEYNVVSRRQIKSRHRLDALVAVDGSEVYDKYVAFFQAVRGRRDVRKGLLRIEI